MNKCEEKLWTTMTTEYKCEEELWTTITTEYKHEEEIWTAMNREVCRRSKMAQLNNYVLKITLKRKNMSKYLGSM